MSSATKVIMQDGQTKPLDKIGLRPLGKILSVLLMNRDLYQYHKEQGQNAELEPIACGSNRAAGYIFKPTIEFTPQVSELKVSLPPAAQGGQPLELGPEELLPGSSADQTVEYWRNVRTESDLPRNFEPSRIAEIARPVKLDDDVPGVPLRLEAMRATYSRLARKVRRGMAIHDQSSTALRDERLRLLRLLSDVRTKLLARVEDHLEKLPEDQRDEFLMTQRVNRDQAAGTFIDALRERQRLEALLARVEETERQEAVNHG